MLGGVSHVLFSTRKGACKEPNVHIVTFVSLMSGNDESDSSNNFAAKSCVMEVSSLQRFRGNLQNALVEVGLRAQWADPKRIPPHRPHQHHP